uniref:Uncharacterized protein n=1 Tax=Haptolina brevifila TaxID=156173 RepID=A0A7S2CIN4_9EUKA
MITATARCYPVPRAQVKKLHRKQAILETNIARTYDVAKARIDHRSSLITAARLQTSGPSRHDALAVHVSHAPKRQRDEAQSSYQGKMPAHGFSDR